MRKEFQLTEEQFQKLIDASKPEPYMIIGNVTPRSPQEKANDAWKTLGKELGFAWNTVRPVNGKNQKYFTAETL